MSQVAALLKDFGCDGKLLGGASHVFLPSCLLKGRSLPASTYNARRPKVKTTRRDAKDPRVC